MSVTKSSGQKPDGKAIAELTEYLRAVRTVGWSKHLDRPSDNGLHLAKNMNRNFAVLQLCLDDGSSIGVGWLGVSGEPGYSPPSILNEPIILASEPYKFLLNVKKLLALDFNAFLEPLFAPLPNATMACSEIPLLNGLGYWLQCQDFPNDATGTLYLLTERLPCMSCGHVMREFKKSYPNFKIHLLYMFDHTAHVSKRLATDLSNLANYVHLIEVIDGDDKGFVGSMGPVFGSAANPARSAINGSPIVPVESNSNHITIHIVGVSARKPGEWVVEPTSKATEVMSRGAGSPSAHFHSNILSSKSSRKPEHTGAVQSPGV